MAFLDNAAVRLMLLGSAEPEASVSVASCRNALSPTMLCMMDAQYMAVDKYRSSVQPSMSLAARLLNPRRLGHIVRHEEPIERQRALTSDNIWPPL